MAKKDNTLLYVGGAALLAYLFLGNKKPPAQPIVFPYSRFNGHAG